MGYNVKWRADEEGPLRPETCDTFDAAKQRVRQLLVQHGKQATIEVWNDDETWQIVSAAGIEEWSQKS